ncbi:atonal -like 7-like [Asbolus verrucosus]|uniref:Atonal-like 7-like n=1 Tax=Asbolus verrucosus TaxID=1661398 RepID=A0A482VZY3_ASBVE|nr:atonal -like 7-like [Asbolus verrucosus]
MSSQIIGNTTPLGSSCMYSATTWTAEDFYSTAQITAPQDNKSTKDEDASTRRDKNRKGRGYKHVPHKDKPAQVVARRNARERRRVQAVNTAFARLRKVVPVENARGKRISKVKTLQNAIDYIHNLQQLLEQDRNYQSYHSHYYSHKMNEDFFNGFNFDDEL